VSLRQTQYCLLNDYPITIEGNPPIRNSAVFVFFAVNYLSDFADNDAGIVAAEAKGVAHRNIDLRLSGL